MRSWLLALCVACGSPTPAAPVTTTAEPRAAAQEGDELLGRPAPAWQTSRWFNSPPLSIEGLRGKVVLLRWFTSPDCPFCSASAPVLRTLHDRYAARGLVVVGMYHHKRDEPLDAEDVAGWAEQYGYRFPVAIDDDWTTLKRYWLDGHERRFTSVSFLVDRQGKIRRIHPGGTIEEQELPSLAADVEQLLAE